MTPADFIRLIGLATGAMAVGGLIVLGFAPLGTTAFAPPARYYGVATGLLIETAGIIARVALWGQPINIRDIIFVVANLMMSMTVLSALYQRPHPKELIDERTEQEIRDMEARLRMAREAFRHEVMAAKDELERSS